MDYTDRINRLREELNRHNHNYYVLNAPEISDKDFDMLMKELEALEKEHPEAYDPLSPKVMTLRPMSRPYEASRCSLHPVRGLRNSRFEVRF